MIKYLLTLTLFVMMVGPVAADPIPPSGRIEFDIIRNGSLFGTHTISFEKTPDGKTIVDIDIQMRYALGPVVLFRYEHKNREIWQGNRLLSVSSKTNDDGRAYQVEKTVPAGLISTSYWNPSVLKEGKILNTQKGTVESIRVARLGSENYCIPTECMQTRKISVETETSPGPITIWYDMRTGQWVGMKFTARGSEIVYQRRTPVHRMIMDVRG
jgi:hypothetical protein